MSWACVRAGGQPLYCPDGVAGYHQCQVIVRFAETSGIDTWSPSFGLTTGGQSEAGHLIYFRTGRLQSGVGREHSCSLYQSSTRGKKRLRSSPKLACLHSSVRKVYFVLITVGAQCWIVRAFGSRLRGYLIFTESRHQASLLHCSSS